MLPPKGQIYGIFFDAVGIITKLGKSGGVLMKVIVWTKYKYFSWGDPRFFSGS
jgi:hypothetical protein